MGDPRRQAGGGARGPGDFKNARNRLAALWKPLQWKGLRPKSHARHPDEHGVLPRKCLEINKTILLCEVVGGPRGGGLMRLVGVSSTRRGEPVGLRKGGIELE